MPVFGFGQGRTPVIMVPPQAVATLVALPEPHVVDDKSPTVAAEAGGSGGKVGWEAV